MDNESGVTAAHDVLIQNYAHFLAFAVLYYDHSLTFFDEVTCIWRHPRSISSIGFLLNRYIAFFGNAAVIVVSSRALSEESCEGSDLFRQIILLVNQITIAVLLLLRTYALYSRSTRVLLGLLVTAAALLICGLLLLFLRSGNLGSTVSLAIPGCHGDHTAQSGVHLAAPWEALLAWDVLIFVLTLLRTRHTRRTHSLFTGTRLPLVSILFRDGAVYFGVMSILNLANLFTFYFARPLLKGMLSTFASSISVTMMSRLMLNLHASAEAGVLSPTEYPGAHDTLLLTSIVGKSAVYLEGGWVD